MDIYDIKHTLLCRHMNSLFILFPIEIKGFLIEVFFILYPIHIVPQSEYMKVEIKEL